MVALVVNDDAGHAVQILLLLLALYLTKILSNSFKRLKVKLGDCSSTLEHHMDVWARSAVYFLLYVVEDSWLLLFVDSFGFDQRLLEGYVVFLELYKLRQFIVTKRLIEII